MADAVGGAQRDDEDDEGADVPEEFLDSIMSSLMKDPVRLPSCGKLVDRTTVLHILLNDQIDPFTRAPLKQEQLIEEPELKVLRWRSLVSRLSLC